MRFLRNSLLKKLFFELFLFILLIAALVFFYFYRGEEYVPFYVVVVSLSVFLIYFLLLYFVDVIRPLRVVLEQIQSLLSGKNYKRIYTNRIDEIGIIAHFFNQVTRGLGQFSSDIKDHDRMRDELVIASQLQREILPPATPNISGLNISAKNRPATELGGDSFNFFTSEGKSYLYIGDVTGHGVAAGLVMTMVNSLISVFADTFDSAYDIVVHVNKYIKRHLKKAMFMTLLMLSWDHEKEKLSFVGAGHEHLLIYRGESGECESILAGGVALGMVPDNSNLIKEQEIDLAEGDFVVLYTDGIIEAKNDKGELFGLDRLKESVIDYAAEYSVVGLNYHIARDVVSFMENHPQEDDMTLIVIQRGEQEQQEEQASTTWTT